MMKFLILTSVVLFTITSCNKSPTPLTREEVIAVITKFDEGWRNKNLKAVDSVLAPAYIYFTQSGGTFSRDGVVRTAGSLDYTLIKMNRMAFDVTLYENIAVVSTRWQGKGKYYGTPFDEDQRCSLTIIKHDNKVEILSEHCTPIKPYRMFH